MVTQVAFIFQQGNTSLVVVTEQEDPKHIRIRHNTDARAFTASFRSEDAADRDYKSLIFLRVGKINPVPFTLVAGAIYAHGYGS